MAGPRKAGLGFILVTLFLDILGLSLVVPILPKLIQELIGGDPSTAQGYMGWFTSAYAVMQLVFSPILGSLSDRFGRRPVLLLSMAGMGLNYLIAVWAPSLGWLLVGRLIGGLTAASIATATAYIADVSPPEKRAQAFGLVGMAFGLSFTVGPLIGTLLGQHWIRLPFLVAAGLSLANAAYGALVLPESLPPSARRPFTWSRANAFGTLRELGRSPLVLGLALASFFVELAQRGLENVWTISMGYRFQWTLAQVGLSLGMVGLTQAVMQGFVVRKVMPRMGEKRAIYVGVAIAMVAFVLYGLATEGWMIYAIIPFGAFAGLAPPAAQALMSRSTPADQQGLLQGGLSSMRSVTMVVGPFIASELFRTFSKPTAPIVLPGVSFLSGAVLIGVGLALAVRVLSRPHASSASTPVAATAGPLGPVRDSLERP